MLYKVTLCGQTRVSQHTNASLMVAAGSYYCIFIDISTIISTSLMVYLKML
jgi:hypothetical protein